MISLPYIGIVLQYTFQQGQYPLLPSVYNMEVVLPIEVEVPSIGVLPKSKLDWAQNIWRPCTKRGWNKLPAKRVRPRKIRKKTLCPKKGTTFPTGLQGQMDAWLWRPMCDDFYNCGWWQTCTSNESRCSQEILCQKIKSDLGKNERLGGLKTRMGGPGKN